MTAGTEKWDERYQQAGNWAGTEPAEFLREVLPLLPYGRALDLAMGAGRNAVFLAEHGWRVTGVDRSQAALEKAEALARKRGVAVRWPEHVGRQTSPAGWPVAETGCLPRARRGAPAEPVLFSRSPGLLLLEGDLESWTLPVARFELVLCFNYLQRSVFDSIGRALQSGGMLIYETYTLDQLGFLLGPRNPEHLLRPGELREAFAGLETIFYREFTVGKGIASLLARKM